MEYRRAYKDETPDGYLTERHAKEIFPLLRKRYLFAEVHDFLLYDLYSPEGYVNEDVFAYSNRTGDERALVIFHNKYANTRGWIRMSAAYPVKTGAGDERTMVQKSLGEGLGLQPDGQYFTIFRDHTSGLEYIRSSQKLHEKGLYLELDAYKYYVFVDFREVVDNEWHQYAHLENYLNGKGVPSIEEALKEIFLQSLHRPFRELVNAGQIRWLIQNRYGSTEFTPADLQESLDEVERKALTLTAEIKEFVDGEGDAELAADHIRQDIAASLLLPDIASQFPRPGSRKYKTALNYLSSGTGSSNTSPLADGDPGVWGTLLGWGITRRLGEMVDGTPDPEMSRVWMDEWLLGKILNQTIFDLGLDESGAWRATNTTKLLITHQDWAQVLTKPGRISRQRAAYNILQTWLKDSDVQRFIGVNRFQGMLWFNKEAFAEWLWWMYAVSVVQAINTNQTSEQLSKQIMAFYDVVAILKKAEKASKYQLELLLRAASI